MGFARLHFTDGTLMTHIMYDVVGVLTGQITTTSALQTATISLSTVVNTANSNWSMLYPAALGATRGTSNTSYVLTAPCVDASKTKFIRITYKGYQYSVTSPSGGTAALSSTGLWSSSPAAGNPLGLIMQSCTSASSATALTNATFFNTGNATSASPSSNYNDNQTIFISPYIYLSWSQRHCLIFGRMPDYTVDPKNQFVASFETNETPLTQFRNVAPVVHLNYINSAGNWSSTLTSAADLGLGGKPNHALVLNHYNVTTATASGLHNILSNINSQQDDMPLCSDAAVGAFPSTITKTSSGAAARFVQPLFFHQHHIGAPHMHVSHLSNVYRTAPDMGQENDIVTIGGDTYVYLPTGYDRFNLLVRRA